MSTTALLLIGIGLVIRIAGVAVFITLFFITRRHDASQVSAVSKANS